MNREALKPVALKPCPFCGASRLHQLSKDMGVQCLACGAKAVDSVGWNRRPAPSPELVREIAEKHYTMLGEGMHETIVDAIESAINEALGHTGD